MKLDLTEIANIVGKRIRYEIDEEPFEELTSEIRSVDNIRGDATFSNTGSTIVVRGHFTTVVEVDCARCLSPYRMNLDVPIAEELLLPGHAPEAAEEEFEELPEDEKEPLFENNIFDLTELLRQSILISVPIRTVCMEECKGLCPHCGHNLNEGPCECSPDQGATPFGAMASLLEKEGEESS